MSKRFPIYEVEPTLYFGNEFLPIKAVVNERIPVRATAGARITGTLHGHIGIYESLCASAGGARTAHIVLQDRLGTHPPFLGLLHLPLRPVPDLPIHFHMGSLSHGNDR